MIDRVAGGADAGEVSFPGVKGQVKQAPVVEARPGSMVLGAAPAVGLVVASLGRAVEG